MKKVLSLTAFLVIAFFITACGEDGVDYPVSYFNAEVQSSSTAGEAVTFKITSEGFYPMAVEVTITAGTMTAFTVTDHKESGNWGGALIDDGDFIAAIIANANQLDQLDAEAGVTATSEALMDVARAAMQHYATHYE